MAKPTLQNKDSGSQMKHRRHLHCWLDWLTLIFFHCLHVYNPYTPHHRHSSAIIVTQTNNTTQKKESFDSTLSSRRPGLSSVLYYKRRVRWGTELSGAEWISSALRRCQEDEWALCFYMVKALQAPLAEVSPSPLQATCHSPARAHFFWRAVRLQHVARVAISV